MSFNFNTSELYNLRLLKGTSIAAFCAITLFSTNTYSITAKRCWQLAKTPTDEVYCQLVEKGKATGLPVFNEFQRNTPATKRLLLLGPARKAGITLPQKQVKKNQTSKNQIKEKTAPPTPQNRNNKNVTKKAKPKKQQKELNTWKTQGLYNCVIEQDTLRCPNHQYTLRINTSIRALNSQALTANNRLDLRSKLDDETELQYLSAQYPYYIEKMLAIGLGDSTLSFTKFHAIYEASKRKTTSKPGQHFAQRFREMYELLKKERKAQGIKPRYTNNYPTHIEQCMPLNNVLVTCDNIKQNWVYEKLTDAPK